MRTLNLTCNTINLTIMRGRYAPKSHVDGLWGEPRNACTMHLTLQIRDASMHIEPHLDGEPISPCRTTNRTFVHIQSHLFHIEPHLSIVKPLNLIDMRCACWLVGLFTI